MLQNICGNFIQCRTDDIRDPVSHKVVETTIWVYSADRTAAGYTFYRGRARCEAALAAMDEKKQAELDRYGPQVASEPADAAHTSQNRPCLQNTGEPQLDELCKMLTSLASHGPEPRYHSTSPKNSRSMPDMDDTPAMSAEERGKIGDDIRRCWPIDPSAAAADSFTVVLHLQTDAKGVVQSAIVANDDPKRLGDPAFRSYVERARRAALDPHCARLPLPPALLGKATKLTVRFSGS